MIYEINNKPHVKVENFYAEVEVLNDRMIPTKNFKKIYVENVNKSDIKEYSSIEEYNQKHRRDFDLELPKGRKIRIK